jgi:NAD(P)-dependent dehydrogenase (short-subunit alcohol dehydrogenase family)
MEAMSWEPQGLEMTDYANLFSLEGKRALVIGAGSGIGRATAEGLAAFGAEVVCADIREDAARATAEAIGGKASARVIDVGSAGDATEAAVELAPVDILIITPGINVRKAILDTTDEEVDQVFEVNLKGLYRLLREFGRGMTERGGGSIVAFSSFRAVTVEPGQGIYAATKAGVVQLVRVAADEFGPFNVRVNAVAPGTVATPLVSPIKSVPEWWEAYRQKSILGALVWLASDASSYVTGSLVMLDGGWTAADGRFRPPL